MHIWPALLLAPLFTLTDQSVAYLMVPWACSHQHLLPLHFVHAVFLVATLATLVVPSRALQGHPLHSVLGHEDDGPDVLVITAIGVAVLSAATIVAMWIPQWFLSPCLG
jgi:hypothetical protein